MNLKEKLMRTVTDQLRKHINAAATYAGHLSAPNEGWVKSVRLSLGMSGIQLGARNNVSKAAISKTEKAELVGGVTIKQMEKMAASMGCRFVYGIVPNGSIEAIRERQARTKADAIMKRVSTHMALEDQLASSDALREQRDSLIQELLDGKNGELWDD
jgi:predicted DNA-binding mobile mystery protein A